MFHEGLTCTLQDILSPILSNSTSVFCCPAICLRYKQKLKIHTAIPLLFSVNHAFSCLSCNCVYLSVLPSNFSSMESTEFCSLTSYPFALWLKVCSNKTSLSKTVITKWTFASLLLLLPFTLVKFIELIKSESLLSLIRGYKKFTLNKPLPPPLVSYFSTLKLPFMSTRSYYVYTQGQNFSESRCLPFLFKVFSIVVTQFGMLSLYIHAQEWFPAGKGLSHLPWHSQQKAFL